VIVDFYDYLHKCLQKIKKVTPASQEEIKKNKVDYVLNKEKCKN